MFKLIDSVFGIYELGLFIYILTSWIIHPVSARIRCRLAPFYEPLLAPMRHKILTPGFGRMAIDLSPLILLIGLGIIRRIALSLFW
ncbi:YggT family protein [Tichowtungia aerotolerans]|uniref:YggT family protein n=1 Tax=Tichowtungia aerotolerans TaxID=2697043 RepID=A0A6P1MER5_9BACT|nr:YggT family protein [Tichowtungia aerotolerans]QHI70106.1 YggT family protein [Tichowtungia aerotolerans]